jgi:hypothetical protein
MFSRRDAGCPAMGTLHKEGTMPKETVSRTLTDLDDDGKKETYEISVGWSKDEAIEVRTERSVDRWATDGTFGLTEYPAESSSSSLPLTRRQVNELIRALRKARDSAYGPDA